MNAPTPRRTNETIRIATALEHMGFTLTGVQITTPDGRSWEIAPVPAGRGRHADGHWGPRAGALGGFRLFEVDRDRDRIDEHDAIDGDTWEASELMDYLNAVGKSKAKNPSTKPTP